MLSVPKASNVPNCSKPTELAEAGEIYTISHIKNLNDAVEQNF